MAAHCGLSTGVISRAHLGTVVQPIVRADCGLPTFSREEHPLGPIVGPLWVSHRKPFTGTQNCYGLTYKGPIWVFCGGVHKDKSELEPPWTIFEPQKGKTAVAPVHNKCERALCTQPHSSPTVTLRGPTWACFLGTCSNKSQPVCVQTSVLSDHFVPHYSLSSSYFAVSLPHSRHAAHRDTLRTSSTACRMKWAIDLLWPASASSIQQQVVASGQKRNLLSNSPNAIS